MITRIAKSRWLAALGALLLLAALGLGSAVIPGTTVLTGVVPAAVVLMTVVLAALGGAMLGMILVQRWRPPDEPALEQYRLMVEHAGDGIAVIRNGRIVFANASLALLSGYERQHLVGQRFDRYAAVERLAEAQDSSSNQEPDGDSDEDGPHRSLSSSALYETQLQHADGHLVPVHVHTATAHHDGQAMNLVFVRDISEQRIAAEQIRALNEYMDGIIDNADIWLNSLDKEGRIVIWNKAAERISGYLREEVQGRLDIWGWLYPDEAYRDHIFSRAMDILARGTAAFDLESTIRTKDGRNTILSWNSRTLTNDAGETVGSIAVARDVTLERRAQDALRLHASVFETADPLAITNREGVLVKVNRAFMGMFGYTADEVTGHCLSELHLQSDDSGEYLQSSSGLPQALPGADKWSGEIEARRKDESLLPVRLSVSTVRNAENEITHYVVHWQDISERRAFEAKIQRQALYDPLTGLPNRRLVHTRLEQDLAHAQRCSSFGALLFLDLDHFKRINDAHGHTAGDALLASVAHRVRDILRIDDMAARLGGDEFVVLLGAEAGTREDAATRARNVGQKILAEIRKPVSIGEYDLSVSASVGIALYPADDLDAERLLQIADSAMYRAKGTGGDTVYFYSETVQAETEQRQSMHSQLREAVNGDQLLLHYQPIADAEGNIMDVEALVRWQPHGHRLRMPKEFIPVAEETGLAPTIDCWVLKTACRKLVAWHGEGLLSRGNVPGAELSGDVRMVVNISPRLLSQPEFVEQLRQILQETGAPPASLVLEITEAALHGDGRRIADVMHRIREWGVGFSLDDFGTGHVSLTQLKHLPIDSVKIAQTLVSGIPGDTPNAQVVEALLNMANSLELDVMAEGVETSREYEFLLARGCRLFQGNRLGSPLADGPLEDLLRHRLSRATRDPAGPG